MPLFTENDIYTSTRETHRFGATKRPAWFTPLYHGDVQNETVSTTGGIRRAYSPAVKRQKMQWTKRDARLQSQSRARSTARSGRCLDDGILGWQTTPWRATSRWEQRDHRTHRHALCHLAYGGRVLTPSAPQV
jgi:hypothetical protein